MTLEGGATNKVSHETHEKGITLVAVKGRVYRKADQAAKSVPASKESLLSLTAFINSVVVSRNDEKTKAVHPHGFRARRSTMTKTIPRARSQPIRKQQPQLQHLQHRK